MNTCLGMFTVKHQVALFPGSLRSEIIILKLVYQLINANGYYMLWWTTSVCVCVQINSDLNLRTLFIIGCRLNVCITCQMVSEVSEEELKWAFRLMKDNMKEQ